MTCIEDLWSTVVHGGAAGDAGEHTMLSALCSQRDRFRERVRQVEEQLAVAHNDHQQLRRDLDSARADNVALVERLRFVQGYQSQQRRRAGRTADIFIGMFTHGEVLSPGCKMPPACSLCLTCIQGHPCNFLLYGQRGVIGDGLTVLPCLSQNEFCEFDDQT